jgi:hypothetical protein
MHRMPASGSKLCRTERSVCAYWIRWRNMASEVSDLAMWGGVRGGRCRRQRVSGWLESSYHDLDVVVV